MLKDGNCAALAGVYRIMWMTALTLFALLTAPGAMVAQTMPFEFYGNAIWFEVHVNGSRPLHFQLDTAAGACVLNRSVAEDLKLPVLREYDAVAGSGEKPSRIAMLAPAKLQFGGITLDLHRWAAMPFGKVAKTYGTPIDGLIGYPLMERYVVQIDFDAQTLTFIEPESYRPGSQEVILPLEISKNLEPIVRARLGLPGQNEIEGRFLVDAPYPGTLMFGTPFIHRHDLLAAARKLTPHFLPGTATGVGGKFDLQIGRVESFTLGPYTLKLPLAAFVTDAHAGAFARTDIAGIIGGELLRRFRVTLDYPHGRMMLEKGRSFGDPFQADASGMKVETVKGSFREFQVTEVVENSPAADAGVQTGDRILAVDSRPASRWTLWQIRTLLRKPGQRHAMTLRRGGRILTITLETRQLI